MVTADAVRDQCRGLLWDIAPREPGDTLKLWVHRVTAATGLNASLVKRLRYQECQVIPAHVADRLRDTASRERANRDRAKALKEENDSLLARVRAGARIDWLAPGAGLDAVVREGEDARQLTLPFSGWRKR